MTASVDIEFTLNGVKKRLAVPVRMSVLAMLRDLIGLTGTKYGCGEGECGACTVVVDGLSVNSCLAFAADLDGRSLTTIEGLVASPRGEALRRAFTDSGAVQCGFCTPGLMMQASHLLEHGAVTDAESIRRGIEGNLCRCTGYKKIVEAIEKSGSDSTFQAEEKGSGPFFRGEHHG